MDFMNVIISIIVGLVLVIIGIILIIEFSASLYPELLSVVENVTGSYSQAGALSVITNVFWLIIVLIVIVLFLALFLLVKFKKGKR